jgi:hypothetical protein
MEGEINCLECNGAMGHQKIELPLYKFLTMRGRTHAYNPLRRSGKYPATPFARDLGEAGGNGMRDHNAVEQNGAERTLR